MAFWNQTAAVRATLIFGLTLLAGMSPAAVNAQSNVTTTNPAGASESPPGVMTVLRWDVLLNDDGMVLIDQLQRDAVETTSTLYHASICDAAALHSAIVNAKSVGGMEGSNQNMGMSYSQGGQMFMNQSFYFGYYGGQNQKIRLQGNGNGNESLEATADDRVHLKLDYGQISLRIYDMIARKQAPREKEKPSIIYDGTLPAGQSLMFIGTLHNGATPYYHIIAWEALKIDQRYQQNFQMVRSGDIWCALGPEAIKADADIAAVWAAGAKHPIADVPPKWEQKLEDGKTLKLTAVTRTDKYLFCSWDGDGQPVPTNSWVSIESVTEPTVYCTVLVNGVEAEWKKQSPTGKPLRNNGEQTGNFEISGTFTAIDGKVKVGIPVGDWQKVGEIKSGGSIKIDAKTYRMRPPQAQGNSQFYVQFYPSNGSGADTGDLITLTAVGQDGTELDPSSLSQLMGEGYGMPLPEFEGMALAQVKSYNVWKRKRQWVTLEGFAIDPAVPPPAHVDSASLARLQSAAVQQQAQVQAEAAVKETEAMAARRKEWDAIPIDPTTPKGALRACSKQPRMETPKRSVIF